MTAQLTGSELIAPGILHYADNGLFYFSPKAFSDVATAAGLPTEVVAQIIGDLMFKAHNAHDDAGFLSTDREDNRLETEGR